MSIAVGTAQLAAGGSGVASGGGDAERAKVSAATFNAETRAVSNWRGEAMRDLAPTPLSVLAVALGAERPVVTRCVKLNNYWCIKSARWNGEVGADEEGHTGFASAEHGADAAVRLLRRYYLEFDRKSALDIVRRWAPAECRLPGSSGPPAVLALRGLGNTLRARWLAARQAKPMRTRVAAAGDAVPVPPRRPAGRVSAVPLRPLPTVSMPSIMAGIAAPKAPLAATLAPGAPPRRQPTPASLAPRRAGGRAPPRTAAKADFDGPGRSRSRPPRPPLRFARPFRLAPRTSSASRTMPAASCEGLDLAPGDDLEPVRAGRSAAAEPGPGPARHVGLRARLSPRQRRPRRGGDRARDAGAEPMARRVPPRAVIDDPLRLACRLWEHHCPAGIHLKDIRGLVPDRSRRPGRLGRAVAAVRLRPALRAVRAPRRHRPRPLGQDGVHDGARASSHRRQRAAGLPCLGGGAHPPRPARPSAGRRRAALSLRGARRRARERPALAAIDDADQRAARRHRLRARRGMALRSGDARPRHRRLSRRMAARPRPHRRELSRLVAPGHRGRAAAPAGGPWRRPGTRACKASIRAARPTRSWPAPRAMPSRPISPRSGPGRRRSRRRRRAAS